MSTPNLKYIQISEDNDQNSFEYMVEKIKSHLLSHNSKKIKKLRATSSGDIEQTIYLELTPKIKAPPLRYVNPYKFFRTELDVYLTLNEIEPSGFGQVPSSPFYFTNIVNSISFYKNSQFLEISLEGMEPNITPIEYVKHVFQSNPDKESLRVAQTLEKLQIIHKQAGQQQLIIENSTDEIVFSDIHEMQMIFIIDVNQNGTTKLGRMLINESLLQLLGVSSKMYMDFVMQEKQIPDPFSKTNYLSLWNQVMEACYTNEEPKWWVITYEGINVSVRLQVQPKFAFNEQKKIVQIVQKWIVKLENEKNQELFQKERIQMHENNYFSKATSKANLQISQFNKRMGLQPKRSSQKPCGYKEKSHP